MSAEAKTQMKLRNEEMKKTTQSRGQDEAPGCALEGCSLAIKNLSHSFGYGLVAQRKKRFRSMRELSRQFSLLGPPFFMK